MRILATQGVVITLIAVLYAFIPNVSHAFWIFTALATQVYLIMYVLMLSSADTCCATRSRGGIHGMPSALSLLPWSAGWHR